MGTARSKRLFRKARGLIPGGVNSPVRAFSAVGGEPIFASRARGAKVYDVDGNSYVDYLCSWGPLIAGHGHPQVMASVRKALAEGSSFGLSTAIEVEMAQLVTDAFPSVEMVRFVSSGTEATMSALRLARAATGREVLVKFSGCYHGHADSFLSAAGSGLATFGIPQCAGVPSSLARSTLTLPYNDVSTFERAMLTVGRKVAAVIVEPVAGNMGVVPGTLKFLRALRQACNRYGALLIFDEVITGFRLCFGGAQNMLGIAPDITCLGKIVGGGFPVGAYGGKARLMKELAPQGPVYQAGTLSGNPVAMAAGVATLRLLKRKSRYAELEKKTAELVRGIRERAREAGVDVVINTVGSMFTVFFRSGEVRCYEEAKESDTAAYARFFSKLKERSVLFPPSQFETCFLSLAHTKRDISATVDAAGSAFRFVSGPGS
ncbi:MAG: glutamate-1-semialdehyde 2,1-aminomutase [Candidatus Eiseniibacteriota bacterium]|nr:MAG: glutamate-1-semialdehyde 2,1-aminomutase [Candidatus Eisenbacteria bacterium]